MRIAVAQIRQETNTFNPIPTTLTDFQEGGLYFGDEILHKMRGAQEIGGLMAAAEQDAGAVELLPTIRAAAMSGGPITTDTLEFFEEKLVSGLDEVQPVDGVFVSLHGAAASEKVDDVEGYLLTAIRAAIGHDLPIVVTLDHHANITERMVESAKLLVGYQELPHDPYETGVRAAKMLFALARGEIAPTVGVQKIPMVTPAERYATAEWPMKEWFGLAREMEERPGVISVSPFPVQSWLDVRELGWTAVVYTDNDIQLAQELAGELANKAWELREEFWVVDRVPLDEAIRRAVEAKEGPIMICDASDCVPCGAPGDSTWVLREMLAQEIDCAAFLPMVDPEVVKEAMTAGVGSSIRTLVGGKRDNVFSEPVEVRARVAAVSEAPTVAVTRYGSYDMGATVLLEIGSIGLIVSEHRGVGEIPPATYSEFGLDPAEAKMVVVRTVGRYVARYLSSLVKEAFVVDCPGLAGWDLKQFNWVRRPHPLYPLDELPEWQAKA